MKIVFFVIVIAAADAAFFVPFLCAVDNGVKYDASRAYLSDLNVTENVWIGLMRSQNSDRFMWS